MRMRVIGTADEDREAALRAVLDRGDPFSDPETRAVAERVREILETVRRGGDAAVRSLTLSIEGRSLDALELAPAAWRAEANKVTPAVHAALELAHARVRAFHEPQRGSSYSLDEEGVHLSLRRSALARVGLYVPGGSARYPSSVLMTAVPAKVAGVGEILMVTPGPSPETLLAALLAGVDRVFVIGGAQAVGALAFGTESVPRVDKIVGPGNAWVAEAKRQVFGVVDIDQVAGPSEILVLADEHASPAWIAADLLSQAEHDPQASAVLVTPSLALARAVAAEVARQLTDLPRRDIAERSILAHGAAVVVSDLEAAIAFANRYAPEHLSIQAADADAIAERICAAGAIFVGAHTPEAAGDYLAGPNHVLPTAGAARYGSPLGVYDFEKQTSVLRYSHAALVAHGAAIEALAEVEGLGAHGRAVAIRTRPDRPR
jgi:histidinol dehydrogenase